MKLYVARHGQTQYNAENRVCGSTNLPLTEVGKQQAKTLAEKVKDLGIDVIIASPMTRAMQTAGAVSLATGIPVMMDDRLREHDYGTVEGIDRTKDEYWQQKYQFAAKFPQGESVL
ncbi:MAG: histidine phosphatase family protein, partial [Oscillospiraceae bacterium]|nr:histidine phosphatase family protein [Oscillospiraceae bacterium]